MRFRRESAEIECAPGEICGPNILNREDGSGGSITLNDAQLSPGPLRKYWSSGFNNRVLPGLATLRKNSSIVTTTEDLSSQLENGDLIRIGDNNTVRYEIGSAGNEDREHGLFLVANADKPHAIRLAYVYQGPDLHNRPIWKQDVSADEIIRRIREQSALRNKERMNVLENREKEEEARKEEERKLKEAEKKLEDALVDDMKTQRPNCSGPVLSGTFDALQGSKVVRTSDDIRAEISDGERIQFNGYDAVYVVSQPRDMRTLTISVPYVDEDHKNLTACKVVDENSGTCTPLSGCFDVIHESHVIRTSVDVLTEIEPGEIIRLDAPEGKMEASVTDPRDERTLTISGPYPGSSQDCIKGCKVQNTWDGGLVALCGNVSVTQNSQKVLTSCDLRDSLSLGDLVKIGNHLSPISKPFDDTTLTLQVPYPDPTAKGMKAFKQIREVPLSGTVSVVKGSPILTTTADLREEIRPGDMIKIYQRPNHPDLFAIVAPMDATLLTIAAPHPGPSAFGLKAYKVAGTLNPLSGKVDVVKSSRIVQTTMDLTAELIPGDTVQISNFDTVVTAVDKTSFTLDEEYPGDTMNGLHAFKKGKSAEQSTLEQLALQKLACTTIYCLTKIEEAERALAFSFPRELKAGLGDNTKLSGAGEVDKK